MDTSVLTRGLFSLTCHDTDAFSSWSFQAHCLPMLSVQAALRHSAPRGNRTHDFWLRASCLSFKLAGRKVRHEASGRRAGRGLQTGFPASLFIWNTPLQVFHLSNTCNAPTEFAFLPLHYAPLRERSCRLSSKTCRKGAAPSLKCCLYSLGRVIPTVPQSS